MEPDPAKIEALTKAEPPKNLPELKSFLGMLNYSSKFIKNYSNKTAILRELLHGKKKWSWTSGHQRCFDELKISLQGENVLGCFDVNTETKVIVDASPVGLGAILVQTQNFGEDKVIAYASRSLNETEKRYSQIERECLSVYFACIRFQMYLLGKEFVLFTDHKPLVPMLNKPQKNAPFRIERIMLKLQGFKFLANYLPGNLNPSDFPSRHPVPLSNDDETCMNEELNYYVNQIIQDTMSISITELQRESAKDKIISKSIYLIENGKYPTKGEIPDNFINIWGEFSVVNNLLLEQERLVIPESLKERIVKIAHEGHLGIVNTKRFLRFKVWFKNLDTAVENEVKHCHTCRATTYKQDKEPLAMSMLPNAPWENVRIGVFWPIAIGGLCVRSGR